MLAAGFAGSAARAQSSDSLLAVYIEESWRSHPDLESMRAMVAAESSRTVMSRAWMNPELRAGLMNVPETGKLKDDPMTMLQIGVMQQIPFPGKRSAAGRAGDARTRAAQADVENAKFEMAAMVAMAYYDLAAALAAQRVLERGRDLTGEMMRGAAAMISAGMGAQADVLRARLEQDEWTLRLINNQTDIERKRANLAYTVGREDPATLPDPILPDAMPPLPDLATALAPEQVNETPELREAQLRREAAGAELRRARLGYWPDLELMLSYGIRQDLETEGTDPHTGQPVPEIMEQDNMISIELTAPIPLFFRGNQRADIGEMRAMRRAAEQDAARASLLKQQELRELHAELAGRVERHQLVTGSIQPQAEDTWRATLIDYRAAKIPFMNLAEARMAVVMSEMDAIMLRADAWADYARWLAARGQPFTATAKQ